jgi:hypothetical protein
VSEIDKAIMVFLIFATLYFANHIIISLIMRS